MVLVEGCVAGSLALSVRCQRIATSDDKNASRPHWMFPGGIKLLSVKKPWFGMIQSLKPTAKASRILKNFVFKFENSHIYWFVCVYAYTCCSQRNFFCCLSYCVGAWNWTFKLEGQTPLWLNHPTSPEKMEELQIFIYNMFWVSIQIRLFAFFLWSPSFCGTLMCLDLKTDHFEDGSARSLPRIALLHLTVSPPTFCCL